MKKHIIISAILILLAYVVGFFVGDALAVKEYNMERSRLWATQSEQVRSEKWTKVATFKGEGIKNTKTFKVTAKDWRIVWETSPSNLGDMNFLIYVYQADGNPASPFVIANTVGEANDTSYMRGKGEYYLGIISGQKYKITIEEKK
jgi:hypothetical protein